MDTFSSIKNNVMSLLENTIDKTKESEKSGIYQIQCKN